MVGVAAAWSVLLREDEAYVPATWYEKCVTAYKLGGDRTTVAIQESPCLPVIFSYNDEPPLRRIRNVLPGRLQAPIKRKNHYHHGVSEKSFTNFLRCSILHFSLLTNLNVEVY